MSIEIIKPADIEKKSFSIISEILGDRTFDPLQEPIIKRAIHTSADFDYADNLYFSQGVVSQLLDAIRQGADIVTDTQMAKAGISKKTLQRFGGQVHCFISDEDVAREAKERGVTRAVVSRERAWSNGGALSCGVGYAPTALLHSKTLTEEGRLSPVGVVGVPVGFVNVVESKEEMMKTEIPCIVARGRKGGSNIAAAICNALLYMT